ncbi:MAG: nucleoside triphosphate pyrophosphohydrolase [Blastocatellia bacterium AA13]|nr:MAG: nucleoside triphosphate pyrophosphohydrolase [Blastocatellia bacterium AA13]
MPNDVAEAAGESFRKLVELIARLRAPGGCPWDREQTHQSLKPMLLEEAYEVVEAIDDGDDDELTGELGDLLLQVVFHSDIATEEKRFDVGEVIERVTAKMIRRHPHVFAGDKAETATDVLRSWEAIKAAELAEKGKPPAEGSMLDSISSSLPAAMETYQMTTKVSRVGFDWPDADSVVKKVYDEMTELEEARSRDEISHREIVDELGDVMFVLVNVARHLGVDPESALKSSNRKFRRRFRFIEDRLRERGSHPAASTIEEMDQLWADAKKEEKARRQATNEA